MLKAKVLTFAALMTGTLFLFSCEKEKTYPQGTGIPNLPASDTVRPAFVNTSDMDVRVRVYMNEVDYQANQNIVGDAFVKKGQQYSFKTLKGSDSVSYVIEWFSADGYTSNWLDSAQNRVYNFAKQNGVKYLNFANGTADSSHLFALGATGDSVVWNTVAFRDSVVMADSVDVSKQITLHRDFTATVAYQEAQSSVVTDVVDDVTYTVDVSGAVITVVFYKDGTYYGYMTNKGYNLDIPAGSEIRNDRARAKFAGNNRIYAQGR